MLHLETKLNVIVMMYVCIYIYVYKCPIFLDGSLTLVGGVYPSTKKEILDNIKCTRQIGVNMQEAQDHLYKIDCCGLKSCTTAKAMWLMLQKAG